MEKKIPLPSTSDKVYRQYVELINPVLKLRGKEIEVLAELLKYNNELKNIKEKNRWKLIMDYDNKSEICDTLDISEGSLANNLSSLRKKGWIVDNKVIPGLCIYPNGSFKLEFDFKIVDDKKGEDS